MSHQSLFSRGLAALAAAAILVATVSLAGRPFRRIPICEAPDAPPPKLEWPMFGGTPQRNMVQPFARNLPVEWSVEKGKEKNVKWVADLGSKAHGGPVIAGGHIFVGTNNQRLRDPKLTKPRFDGLDRPILRDGKPVLEPVDLGVLMCFREADGKFLWQAVHEKLPGGQEVDWPREGLVSSPAVEGDRLYYISNRCEVVCASVENGKAIWTLDMIKDLGVAPHNISACSPIVVDDLVYVVTGNGVNKEHLALPAPQAPSFIAVNRKTGKLAWKDTTPTAKFPANANPGVFKVLADRGEIVTHGQWSNPAFGVVNGVPQVIFPGGDGWIYSFSPAGKLIWKFDANPKNARYSLKSGERSDIIGTPVIYKNRVYIGLGQDPEHKSGIGHFWCIDMTRKGDVSPELRLANDAVVKNANSAVVWHYGGAIDDVNVQKKLRRYYYFGRTLSTCAIHEDILYISDLDGILHCLDANTGKVHWEHNFESEIWASPFYADGKIYLGTDQRDLWVFAHGREKKVLAELELDGRIRRPVVAAGDVLYVQTENRLYAIAKDR